MADVWHYYCPHCGRITNIPTWIRVIIRCYWCGHRDGEVADG